MRLPITSLYKYHSPISVVNGLFALLSVLIIDSSILVREAEAQLYSNVLVSNTGTSNNIGQANLSRNIAIDQSGNIYAVFSGSAGIRVAKSTNRGQSFAASVQVTSTNVEAEITVSSNGRIHVVWSTGGTIFISSSTNGGTSFSAPSVVGSGYSPHIATYGANVYVLSQAGTPLYRNANNGTGAFTTVNLTSAAYSDILVDPTNGDVYAIRDSPTITLQKSTNGGVSFSNITLSPVPAVYYSSYTFSVGPLGKFIFVAGSSATPGYRINLSNGSTNSFAVGSSSNALGRTMVADEFGNLVDGYPAGGSVHFRLSTNQGTSFAPAVSVATATSHNIFRNPFYQDIVVIYANGGQVYCTVYGSILPGVVTNPMPIVSYCSGDAISVPFTASGTFNAGNVFTVQLSDASGSFTSPVNIGTLTSTTSGTVNATIPSITVAGSGYRIRVVSSDPVITGSSNLSDITVQNCAPDYTITTTGNQIVITDMVGYSDVLTLSNNSGALQFNAPSRTYSLDGGPIIPFPVSVPLAGVTQVTVNAEEGDDVIDIGAMPAAFPSLTVSGGVGDDAVNFNGNITFASNANLNVDLQDDDAAPGIDRFSLASSRILQLSGTGAVTIKVSRNVITGQYSRITTVNGDLTVEANQQATPTSGSFIGVDVGNWLAGIIESTGTGQVSVKGRGGDSGTGNHGIMLERSCFIRGGTTGTALVQGTGGASSGDNNHGVRHSGSTITSTGANVNVIGQGGGSGASTGNNGVDMRYGTITAGSSGTVTVTGTGGASSGDNNHGVRLYPSVITSTGANVNVIGQGGGSGASTGNYGVLATATGIITAGGSGTVTVTGTGGTSTGNTNYGVHITGTNARITSSAGAVSVTGNGGGNGASTDNYGVYVASAGQITAGSSGTVAVTGTGGPATADNNHGVIVSGFGSFINSNTGNVSVTGTGGGTGASARNYGVHLNAEGRITAGTGGTVTVLGSGGPSSGHHEYGVYVSGNNSWITSTNGTVDVTGFGGGNGTAAINHGVLIDLAAQISAGGTADVSVTGTGGMASGTSNDGVRVDGSGSMITASGLLTVTGTGGGTGGSGSNMGVHLNSSGVISSSGSGTLTVTGAGGGGSGANSYGVNVGSPCSITSSAGNIQVTGTGGGVNSNSTFGVNIFGTVSASGSGNVALHGTGGSGNTANGVRVFNNGMVQTVNGNIHVTAINPLSTSAFTLDNFFGGTPSLECTGTGSITVEANTMRIINAAIIRTSASGSVTLRPQTAGNEIRLGSDDVANTVLGLTDAELDRILTPTPVINIGDVNSGALTINAAITRPYLTNVNLFSGTGIAPDFNAVDINTNGGTLTLGTGSTLNIDIDGTTANTEYKQLAVAGLVNLNSAALTFAGSTHTPTVGETFIIVNNDLTDAVTGTFAGLAEGDAISNFLGSPLVAIISYVGGDGNDVVLTVQDCDIWYLDADNDGWYVNSQTACSSPGVGWTDVLPLGGNGDCDDSDANVWQTLSGYTDTDGDGYTVGAVQNVCSGASLPSGYTATSLGTDCNDSDAATYPGAPCNDGSLCTTNDALDANCNCVGGAPLNCDDGDPSTTDSCDPLTGCIHTPTATAGHWTGLSNTLWDNPGNWADANVPGTGDEAIIPTTPIGGNMPTVNIPDAAAGDITIQTGAILTISTGNALTVDGVLTNDGTVNVQNAASLVQTSTSTLDPTATGTFNVTRNGSGVYDYWSAPTVGTTTSFLGGNVFQYNPATGSMDNADDNTGSGDPGWANASGIMTAARGYAAYGAGTKTFTGTVHNGDVPVAVEYYTPEPEPFSGTFVQGVPYNLIGNPYPSGIDIGPFLFENNAAVLEDGTVYLWDDPGTGPGSYATGDYAEMNAATFTSGGGATASTYPVIGSHQGFKVRVRSGVTEVNFTNDMRTAGNTASFFKQDDRKLLWLSVVSSGNHYNQTAIAFFDDATDAADWGYDAPKLNTSSALSLFSYMDGTPYGIQVYGPLQASREVPLGLHTMQPQSVTFRLDSTENMPTGDIILEDRLLGTFHDLRASDHTCAVAGGLYDARFFLHLSTELVTAVDGLSRNPCMGAWMHDGILTVVTDGATSAGTPIELLDMQGRTVWRASLTGERTVTDLSGLARGVYSVRMADANGPCAIKVVR